VEVSLVHDDGTRETVRMPEAAVAVLRDVLAKLVDSERVAVLREDEELSPEQAAGILGISRPLVVRRMDSGRLPFRYVGAHRPCRLSDVLRLQQEEQRQREAIDRLADYNIGARNTVHAGGEHESYLLLPIVPPK
jgi:hypothetical protein